ncbi:TPA: hypothetical protein HA332_13325 [Sulfurisphaera tokodaii]|uniref:Uncharacterized protein n=1 Tax=Sulfurisphaera tokodaii TaxID=111955 RepID=A0A832TIA6_9CREN|nr:hypothetical protein [Sulfurisphaera tokodaii]HII75311.1 hypothetical protein [Sulfurisphaera tokodaii]
MDFINITLLYLISGNYTHYYLLITILNMASTSSILVNMTVISHNVTLSYVVHYPSFLLINDNMTSNNITQYDGIEVGIIHEHNFVIYVDKYNGIVIHYLGNGINATLIGASIPLGPGINKPIPSYFLHHNIDESKYNIETLLLTIIFVASFYFILQRVDKSETTKRG